MPLFNLDFSPKVIRPGLTPAEQDRISSENALRDAQMQNIRSETQYRGQSLSLEQRKQQVSEFLGNMGIQHDQKQLDELHRHNVSDETARTAEQGIQTRGQDLQAKNAADLHQTAALENLTGHLTTLSQYPDQLKGPAMKLLGDLYEAHGDSSLKKILTANEATMVKPKDDFSSTAGATQSKFALPDAYKTDPQFTALAPALAKAQKEQEIKSQYGWGERLNATLTGRSPEEVRKANALVKLRQAAGLDVPGIPY